MSRRPTLPEPVEVAKFWKNRAGEAVITSLRTHEDYNLVDLRTHFTTRDGKFQPTRNGLTVNVRKLPELLKAVTRALAKARELGLIEDDGASEAAP